MKKSNIFAYIELSKLADGLRVSGSGAKPKEQLKSQAAYFNIIEPKYFSDELIGEWENILGHTKKLGAKLNAEGRVISNAVTHTIENMTESECRVLVDRVNALYDKLKKEFE
ncbi:hypothetical protein [Dyadobacter sp. LHD-138]|uniref:hypothetical protein n=1 Tax=Dyadobacter sp. LHD-138 TaxID=3071413 RepID=UPI0027E16149|nr:hypothetical protein [Dyadobacter sp. LHD-138]MDQ6479647.1 hypothetical protein [Dyadobacter sp. LHD-138]